jgi:hypothetical protein
MRREQAELGEMLSGLNDCRFCAYCVSLYIKLCEGDSRPLKVDANGMYTMRSSGRKRAIKLRTGGRHFG